MPFIKFDLRKVITEETSSGPSEVLSIRFPLIVNLNDISIIYLDDNKKYARVVIRNIGEHQVENYSFQELEELLTIRKPLAPFDSPPY